VAIRLALIATLAGEHLLLIGPPGTAKSLLARRLRLAFRDATYFERLLTKFTVPEELFGPLSIKALEEDRYERQTEGYLPSAAVGFLDEIFKANSAILNALLTLLNEREFDNGSERVKTPLVAVVGASNELPESDGLGALFDRFLLRLHVGPVSAHSFPALLAMRGDGAIEVPDALKLDDGDLRAIREQAGAVEVPDDIVALLRELREWCAGQQIEVSDRRWRKVVKLLQVSAFTNGWSAVSVWDCWLLQHCLWNEPEQREKVYEWYAARVGASAAMDPSRLTKLVVAREHQLKRDQEDRAQRRDAEGNLLYIGPDRQATTDAQGELPHSRGKEPLYLAPPNARHQHSFSHYGNLDRTNDGKGFTEAELDGLIVDGHWFKDWRGRANYLSTPANRLRLMSDLLPAMEPTRHKPHYVSATLGELGVLRSEVVTYLDGVNSQQQSLERVIRTHLWVTEEFLGPAVVSLERTRNTVEGLQRRVVQLIAGFEQLPREEQSPTDARPRPAAARKRPK